MEGGAAFSAVAADGAPSSDMATMESELDEASSLLEMKREKVGASSGLLRLIHLQQRLSRVRSSVAAQA